MVGAEAMGACQTMVGGASESKMSASFVANAIAHVLQKIGSIGTTNSQESASQAISDKPIS